MCDLSSGELTLQNTPQIKYLRIVANHSIIELLHYLRETMKSNEISQHLATFVRIVNATQTIEFHEWNGESLDRAFSWANALEMLPEKCDATILDAALKQLNTASIPTIERGDHIRIEQLRQGIHTLDLMNGRVTKS